METRIIFKIFFRKTSFCEKIKKKNHVKGNNNICQEYIDVENYNYGKVD